MNRGKLDAQFVTLSTDLMRGYRYVGIHRIPRGVIQSSQSTHWYDNPSRESLGRLCALVNRLQYEGKGYSLVHEGGWSYFPKFHWEDANTWRTIPQNREGQDVL
jgi:hypothetical protein